MKRSLVSKLQIGESAKIMGWVQSIRSLGGITFVLVRERTGFVQCVFKGSPRISRESVVEIVGRVHQEPRAPGQVEIKGEKIRIVSEAAQPLSVETGKSAKLSLPQLIESRPLSLRQEKQQAIFKIKAELVWAFREFMRSQGFVEIHSTKLTSGGLEGGSEVFPVKYFGKTAWLAQSPQFYKQMMVGVYERVFEVGKVYRAEPHATTRHLAEYVGLDYEIGFIESVEEVMEMEEKMLKFVFGHLKTHCPELKLFEAKVPEIETIPRITFAKAKEMIRGKCPVKESGLTPEMERAICQEVEKEYGSELVFITKYPLGERPFYTMPSKEEGCSESFELLYKGLEITTGSQRIHQYEELKKAIVEAGMKLEGFKGYLMCFKYGMPPHGGVGIGTERIIKELLGLGSVEEASLIPRTKQRFHH
ncbi:MAG: aspartate--tRNA(Asn) ligase [Candidatus Woesearchaeota archaeon]|nr:aspartate--tRNA(Asn) ligase [Candidatus Woesearchaeota archaeon]MDP7198028.1 aspartate--tRNA(Asn) ligase [Candidatus Woesearchaeota archaeon]MDP7466862.1 aspartate--tRNA(Asn) ligase [Candidatus Woesearchaeota archaeon]MDP7647298.1 aspartate--tRNA(Asn) ligase [Candidatus Woesearchaeota archaeon]